MMKNFSGNQGTSLKDWLQLQKTYFGRIAEIIHWTQRNHPCWIFHTAPCWILELHYNFLDIFGDVNNFEELKMDTDSVYLGFTEEYL